MSAVTVGCNRHQSSCVPIMPSRPLHPTVYSGTFIHCKSYSELEVLKHALIGVDEKGVIRFLEQDVQLKGKSLDDVVCEWGWDKQDREWDLVDCKAAGRSWFFPGFIGTLKLISSFDLVLLDV